MSMALECKNDSEKDTALDYWGFLAQFSVYNVC